MLASHQFSEVGCRSIIFWRSLMLGREQSRAVIVRKKPPWATDAWQFNKKKFSVCWLKMVNFLIGHYTYRMFPPAIDIIPTSLAVAYSIGKYTNRWLTTSHTLQPIISIPVSDGKPLKSRKTVAHQREREEWPVGTFCKYNVLLGNLPLYYRMFPPAIDRYQSLLTLVVVVSYE